MSEGKTLDYFNPLEEISNLALLSYFVYLGMLIRICSGFFYYLDHRWNYIGSILYRDIIIYAVLIDCNGTNVCPVVSGHYVCGVLSNCLFLTIIV